MQLVLNGDSLAYEGTPTIAGLLEFLHTEPGRVAVVVNDEVVIREQRASRQLHPGDRVELVTFAAGG